MMGQSIVVVEFPSTEIWALENRAWVYLCLDTDSLVMWNPGSPPQIGPEFTCVLTLYQTDDMKKQGAKNTFPQSTPRINDVGLG